MRRGGKEINRSRVRCYSGGGHNGVESSARAERMRMEWSQLLLGGEVVVRWVLLQNLKHNRTCPFMIISQLISFFYCIRTGALCFNSANGSGVGRTPGVFLFLKTVAVIPILYKTKRRKPTRSLFYLLGYYQGLTLLFWGTPASRSNGKNLQGTGFCGPCDCARVPISFLPLQPSQTLKIHSKVSGNPTEQKCEDRDGWNQSPSSLCTNSRIIRSHLRSQKIWQNFF